MQAALHIATKFLIDCALRRSWLYFISSHV